MEKTDSLFLKYTKRALINAQTKPTKRIKRLHETQPKHNKHITTTQKQPGHTTPTTTKRNSNRIIPSSNTNKSTTQLYTPPSRHTHPTTHKQTHTNLQYGFLPTTCLQHRTHNKHINTNNTTSCINTTDAYACNPPNGKT